MSNKKYSQKVFVLLTWAAVAAMLLSGCGTPQTAQAPVAETPVSESKILKVGVEAPLTGPSASAGVQIKDAVEMAFEKINYKIGDYTVQLVWIDSQSNPEIASRAYEDAVVKDGIQTGLLNWNSSVAVALMEVTAKYKIPHFFTMGATDIVNEKFRSNQAKYSFWNFKMWPSPSKLTANYVTAVNDTIAAGLWDTGTEKRAFIYGEDTDWGRNFGNSLKVQLQETGWTIVGEKYFALDQTDFQALMAEIQAGDVDLIGGTSTAPDSLAAFIKQADESDIKSLIIADGMGWIGDWYKLTGKSSNYVIDQIPEWTTPEAKAFAQEFEAKWNLPPSPSSAGLAYDASNFFIRVLQATYDQHGVLNKETIYQFSQENMQTGKFTYTDGIIMGEYKYTEETVPDPVVGAGYFTFPILQYENGKGLVVWPAEWKVKDLEVKP